MGDIFMMYARITLQNALTKIGDEGVRKVLSSFSSFRNPDTESYLKDKAIDHAKHGITQTHLVFANEADNKSLLGYFTIMQKSIYIDAAKLSINSKKRVLERATYDNDRNRYKVNATLIVQFSKNFTNGVNKYISGDELLDISLDVISEVHTLTGGNVVYLECYDIADVKDIYKRNGFIIYGSRPLDDDEKHEYSGKTMIQMLRIVE